MAIDSKNLLVWVKAMSRGQALPLDASEVHATMEEAESYASTSAIAYPGQTIKVKQDDGKYHTYTLQPSETGYILEEIVVGGSGGNSGSGEDGFSPIATVEQTDTGAVISITDKNGTTTANILNGNTPEIKIMEAIQTSLDGTTRYGVEIEGPRIIHDDGTFTVCAATVWDGKDGKTPVRGEDYWTDDDKTEIKSYVDNAILGGEW